MCFAPQRRALFMSHLASWLRTRRFSEPTFRPSGATNHWKNTVNRDFPIFSRIYLFFLLIFLFSLPLPCSAFQLSILSEVLASKLPSIIYTPNYPELCTLQFHHLQREIQNLSLLSMLSPGAARRPVLLGCERNFFNVLLLCSTCKVARLPPTGPVLAMQLHVGLQIPRACKLCTTLSQMYILYMTFRLRKRYRHILPN